MASIRGWWRSEVKKLYPDAVFDSDHRRWWRELRVALAALEVGVTEDCWRYRLVYFSLPLSSRHQLMEQDRASAIFIYHVKLARGPLRDYETIINLIASTTTAKGLKVTCRLDRRKYPTGRKLTDEEMKRFNVERNKSHGEWNDVIKPSIARKS